MKIIGLTRIRNESRIIKETLDHMATFCDMVFVYDDASTDNTVEICLQHHIVEAVIQSKKWDPNRKRAEWQNRRSVLKLGQKYATPNDWFVYMDADERIEFDFSTLKNLPITTIAIRMKLFDFYITPADVKLHYSIRKFCGSEYRNILMCFRNHPKLDYSSPDQREVHLRHKGEILQQGYVKHYGKGISVEQWEETCDYYARFFPKYSAKWNARKGKAVHTVSSFGRPLIQWHEKHVKGVLVNNEIRKYNIYDN